MFWYAMQSRLNMTLQPWEGMGRAEEAERAFRASKGYEPDTFWYRLKKKLRK